MLDRLPPSLQQHILLEWLSPSEVHIIASQTGNTSLRRAVLTSPCSFRAAPCEILNDVCVRWFHYHYHQKLRLVLSTTVERNPHVYWNYGGWVGSVYYRCNGKLHRDDDLPAFQLGNTLQWYRHGQLHRDDDKPAVIRADGSEEWYQNGQLHRDWDRPARTLTNGSQEWWQHGKRHRDGRDKPAIVRADGTLAWWKHGVPLK